ncbi:hypothetical protein AB4Z09_18160 [Rhodococcus sp. TAF43]|uniref:hypothetical protein n=1 Tax=Rhodococcus sp. TAF43 TaxID=3237483 RepID=UPI003F979D31
MTDSHDPLGRINIPLLQGASRASHILAVATLVFLAAAFITAFATPDAGLDRIFGALTVVSAVGAGICLVVTRKA